MRILGIESSCDETAAAVVDDGCTLLANVVHSQIDIHAAYGGVIPEVAARSHIEAIQPVIDEALRSADCTWDGIDAIAVTYAPGLVGSLLVGTLAARTLAILKNKPLYAIHHVEAHVYANFLVEQSDGSAPAEPHDQSFARGTKGEVQPDTLSDTQERVAARNGTSDKTIGRAVRASKDTPLTLPSKQPSFPMLALIVSGGHSQLVLFKDHGDYTLLGQTQDDAVGEAFDKVAKILGLPYPGGPSIATAAQAGDPKRYPLPKARLQNPYDFSFSGLKTAVLRAVQAEVNVDYTFPSHQLPERLDDAQRANFAASFQHIAIETLVDKTCKAFDDFQPASVVIAGGVAASSELRRQLSDRLPIPIEYAPMQLCTDNAAMIATLAYFVARTQPPADPYDFEVQPSLTMASWQAVK